MDDQKKEKEKGQFAPSGLNKMYEYVATQEYIIMRNAGVIWRPGPSTLKALAFTVRLIKMCVSLGEKYCFGIFKAIRKNT